MLIAIDPGRDTGWACFDSNRRLVKCGLGDPRQIKHYAVQIVIERPQVYDRAHSKGDPNDLITLAIQAGKYIGYFERQAAVLEVLPKDWKGQVPKDIHNARVWALLDAEEQGLVPALPASKRHNVMDAIGLGLWWLRRLKGPTAPQQADRPGY